MSAGRIDRRQVVAVTGLGITSSLLPVAARSASTPGGSSSGAFSPVLSALGTGTVGTSVRTNNRTTFEYRTSTGGTLDAVVWQIDPDFDPEYARLTPRVSFHLGVPSNPSDGSAATPNLGVCVPVAETYDAALHRITLVADSPIVIPAPAPPTETSFWLQFYGVGANVGIMFSPSSPDPYTPADGDWSFFGLAGSPSYSYAPTVALGTYA